MRPSSPTAKLTQCGPTDPSRNRPLNLASPSLPSPARRWLPPAAFALAAAAVVVAAVVMTLSMRAETRRRAGAALDAVAALKVAVIQEAREDQLRTARSVAGYPSIARAIRTAATGAPDAALRAHVVEVLGNLAAREGYFQIALVAQDGRALAEWKSAIAPDAPIAAGLLQTALATPAGAADALAADAADRPYLDIAVAARVDGAPPCAIALRADAAPLFDDILERWPVPSETAHAALVTGDGSTARLFLPRRNAPGANPVVRIPMSEAHRAAVRAMRGEAGVLQAIDRHRVPVLVAIRPIEGTQWKLVTRTELAEIDAAVARPAGAIGVLVAALLLAGGGMLALWWRQESARAAMEAQLRDGRERLELALSGTHEVWDWDLRAQRFEVHPRSAPGGDAGVLRGTADEVLAQVVHPDDLAGVRARLESHLRGDAPLFETEHRTPASGADARWVLARGRVSRRDERGRPLRFTGVVADVTERREMQARLELAQRMAGLGTLAAGVAHEINNPLASLSANLDFLAAEGIAAEGDPELSAALAEARDGAERVRDVVRGLQAFSRPGATSRTPVDVRAELEAALRLAQNELRHRARVEVRIDPVPFVEAARHELGQVFLNLLVNAAQAIPEGRAEEHSVSVLAGTDAEGRARVEIRDTGSGIPGDVLARIFDPFYTTKPSGVGTGLGLAIAHRIVTGVGGRIEVESRVGQGSVFRVTLPAAAGPARSAAAAPTWAPAPGPARRLLVVDDDALVARALVRTLSPAYAVETAGSALEALERLESGERFDAVLCDLMMPQMTGMELHARMAARDPVLAARMVFITGGAFSEAATRFLAETRNGWIEKPFEAGRLRDAIERALAAR